MFVVPCDDEASRQFIEELYHKYARLMFHIARQYFDDDSCINEAVADSCMALCKNISLLKDLSEQKQKAYLIKTVRNCCINISVRRKKENSLLLPVTDEALNEFRSSEDIEAQAILSDELTMTLKWIAALPEKEREVMRLKFLYDKTDAEIADALGLSPSSIGKYIQRARQKLKDKLYGKEDEQP